MPRDLQSQAACFHIPPLHPPPLKPGRHPLRALPGPSTTSHSKGGSGASSLYRQLPAGGADSHPVVVRSPLACPARTWRVVLQLLLPLRTQTIEVQGSSVEMYTLAVTFSLFSKNFQPWLFIFLIKTSHGRVSRGTGLSPNLVWKQGRILAFAEAELSGRRVGLWIGSKFRSEQSKPQS